VPTSSPRPKRPGRRLAASGRTNREIADALFLSPKTVEVNLNRIYRKLGVRSRTALAARFAGERVERRVDET